MVAALRELEIPHSFQ